MQKFLAIESTHPGMKWWIIPISALVLIFIAIIPAFYFALYRSEGTLRIPKRLRLLALTAAIIISAIVLTALPGLVRSLADYFAVLAAINWRVGATSILIVLRDPRTIGQISTLVGALFNISSILLLVAIFSQASDRSETDVQVSSLLNRVTKVAVISWGLWVAFLVFRVFAMPFVFFQLRDSLVQIGRTAPLLWLWEMMAEAIRTLLIQTCLFAAPYIVYKSLRARAENAINVQHGPELIESGG